MTKARPSSKTDIVQWLRVVLPTHGQVEIRATEIPTDKPGKTTTSAVLFGVGQLDEIAREILRVTNAGAVAVYFTLNVIPTSFKVPKGKWGVSDIDIMSRRLLLIDLDPVRPRDTSSTEAEKAASLAKAVAVREHLRSLGWPEPILADSGNGHHLVYLIDLPNDFESKDLVKGVLAALADRFDDEAVEVDRKVFNASRICKAWGSVARKGKPTEERPHRAGRVIEMPDALVAVDKAKLVTLAATQVKDDDSSIPARSNGHHNGPAAKSRSALERAYGLRGLTNELDIIASAPAGERNDTLNKSVYKLGGLVAAGALSEGEVITGCITAGIMAGPNESKIRATVLRALRDGMKNPRDLSGIGIQANGHANGRHDSNGAEGEVSSVSSVVGASHTQNSGEASKPEPKFKEAPKPIVLQLRKVPEFESCLLPEPLRIWVTDISDRMQCAIEYPAVGAIVSLATLVGRKATIRPKRHDQWSVVPNLWGMIVGRPGVLKSPALEEAMKPLYRLIALAIEAHGQNIAEFNRELMIASARRDAAKDQLKKAARDSKVPDVTLRKLAEEATAKDDATEPPMKRYITNDSTVEKLGELLRDNENGLLVYRDELPGFLKSLEKRDHEGDRAFYLEGWNGSQGFTYDRIGRGTVHIKAVCISLLGGIQPGPLASYIRSALSSGGDDGLLSRFQLAVFPNQDRPFRVVDRSPNKVARDRAFEIYEKLNAFDPKNLGAEEDEYGTIPFFRFSNDAQKFFYRWLKDLETTKLRSGETPAMESHLSKYRSLMPSLALLFHLVDLVDAEKEIGKASHKKGSRPVSLHAAETAAAWCDLLEEHARRIYQSGTDGDVGPARQLADKLAQGLPDPFTARDVVRKGWSGLKTSEDVEQATGLLEEHGWLAGVEVPPDAKGGRPTVRYYRNPKLLEAQVKNEG